MLSKGFITEIIKCKRLSLGTAELRYLNVIAIKPVSAYTIYLYSKKQIDIKNVRKTFQKLSSKGLIERTGAKLPHNAKEYKLTSQGLFQYLLRFPHLPTLYIHLKRYSEDEIMKSLLYQFFESETIEYFLTMFRVIRLTRYLGKCCEAILETVDKFRESRHYKYFTKQGHRDYGRIPKSLIEDLDQLILSEIEDFIFQIAMNSKKKIPDFIFKAKGESIPPGLYTITEGPIVMIHKERDANLDDPNYDFAFPTLALARDTKFTALLERINNEFNDGSKELLYLVH